MQKVIAKKIGGARIAWFENSDSWVQFEEPAWFVYECGKNGKDPSAITRECSRKYKLPGSQCEEFVAAVRERISQLSGTVPAHRGKELSTVSPRPGQEPYSSKSYRLGDSAFTIHYHNRTLEHYMHPPFAHLADGEGPGINVNEFHLYEQEGKKFLQVLPGGKVRGDAAYGNLKRQLHIEIANLIHRRRSGDWMSYVHASAVCDGEKTILLASGSGSGKSTLATLMQTRGLTLFSDDFVPVEAGSGRVFPFPAALSIKRDARPVIEAFDPSLLYGAYTPYQREDPPLWFVPPQRTPEGLTLSGKVQAIVFLKYDPRAGCNYTPLDRVNAFKLFHENARVTRNPEQVSLFMDWLPEIPCGKLVYGNTEAGMDQIENLLIR